MRALDHQPGSYDQPSIFHIYLYAFRQFFVPFFRGEQFTLLNPPTPPPKKNLRKIISVDASQAARENL
jgi:hypothetical protein